MKLISQLLQVREKLVFIDWEQVLVSTLGTAVVETTHIWLPVNQISTPISPTQWTSGWWLRAVCVRLAVGVTVAMARIGAPTVV